MLVYRSSYEYILKTSVIDCRECCVSDTVLCAVHSLQESYANFGNFLLSFVWSFARFPNFIPKQAQTFTHFHFITVCFTDQLSIDPIRSLSVSTTTKSCTNLLVGNSLYALISILLLKFMNPVCVFYILLWYLENCFEIWQEA